MSDASPSGHMPPRQHAGRKRFWKQVSVGPEPLPGDPTGGTGYAVHLDGRSVRLPGKAPLCVASRALAQALAEEWQEAGQTGEGYFTPADLPLTGLAGSMIERIPAAHDGVVESLLAYADSDLLCYRDGANPRLAAQQCKAWDHWVQWLERTFGVEVRVTSGVMPIHQPAQTTQALGAVLAGLDAADLAGLGVAVPAMGSLILGLALLRGAGTPTELVACATLDERAQMAVWGEDTEVTDRIAAIQVEVEHAARFLALVRAG
ncbi:MAG: ATP12 family protein [Acetobacter sp.]|uniref:ATP12 family chaperone protein n=1 Tax=Acetobacter sp. TaxID=440 RepID=UPI0039EC1B13